MQRLRREQAAVRVHEDAARSRSRAAGDEPVGHLPRGRLLDRRRRQRGSRIHAQTIRRSRVGSGFSLTPVLVVRPRHLDVLALLVPPITRHPRAPRPRRLLRGGRGAGGPGAAREAARRRGRPARPRRRLDRELRRAAVRDPIGHERRRGAPALPAGGVPPAATRPLPPVLARRLGHDRGDRPPDRAHRDRRGLPRPRPGRARLRARTRGRVGDPDLRARDDEPHLLARGLDVEGRLQDRVRPPEARRHHRRPPGKRGPLPRAARGASPPRRRAARGGAPQERGHRDDRRARDARRTPSSEPSSPARSDRSSATAHAGSTPATSTSSWSRSRSPPRTRSRATSPTASTSMPRCDGSRSSCPSGSATPGSPAAR